MNLFVEMIRVGVKKYGIEMSEGQFEELAHGLAKELMFFINAGVTTRLGYLLDTLSKSGTKPISLSQDDIAWQIGASRSFISTIIARMKDRDELKTSKRMTRILDRKVIACQAHDSALWDKILTYFVRSMTKYPRAA